MHSCNCKIHDSHSFTIDQLLDLNECLSSPCDASSTKYLDRGSEVQPLTLLFTFSFLHLSSLKQGVFFWVFCLQYFFFVWSFSEQIFPRGGGKEGCGRFVFNVLFTLFFSYLSRHCLLLRLVKVFLVFFRSKLLPEDLQ